MNNDRTDEELRASIDAGKLAEQELGRRLAVKSEHAEQRIKRAHAGDSTAAFNASELRFSAATRCDCGAGMAYPVDIGIHGAWHCSAILQGTASREVRHTVPLPFAFYEIKSEDTPSANGATTREVTL